MDQPSYETATLHGLPEGSCSNLLLALHDQITSHVTKGQSQLHGSANTIHEIIVGER